MKNSKVLKGYLFVAGLMLTVLGAMTLFNPIDFKMKDGIEIATNISLMNDVRGTGALFLGSGITILLGIFVSTLSFTSTIVSILVFLAFGIGRAVSILLDGMPADGLVKATVAEFVIAGLGVFMLLKYRQNE